MVCSDPHIAVTPGKTKARFSQIGQESTYQENEGVDLWSECFIPMENYQLKEAQCFCN